MTSTVKTRTPFGIALNGNQECRFVFYGEAPMGHEDKAHGNSNDSRNLQIVKFNLHNARLLTYCDGKPMPLPDFIAKLTQCVNQ